MTPEQLKQAVLTRHSCKAFDGSKSITAEQWDALATVLQYSPSSINSQPWHFVVAHTAEGKARFAQATEGKMAYNTPKILNASYVVAICSQAALSEAHLDRLLARDQEAGRFADEAARNAQHAGRTGYNQLHNSLGDSATWLERQCYIALGNVLLAAALLGIDACPIEGFDAVRLNEVLNLSERGLHSVVLVALGHRSEQDFNARLPKARLSSTELFTLL
jgi:nitroreductase/dihydropteridine reductase